MNQLNINKNKYCNRCLQPFCYKEQQKICKMCFSTYKKGQYQQHRKNHLVIKQGITSVHRITIHRNKSLQRYFGFEVILD